MAKVPIADKVKIREEHRFPRGLPWVGVYLPGPECHTDIMLREDTLDRSNAARGRTGKSAAIHIQYGASKYVISLCGLSDLERLGKWLAETAAKMKADKKE